MKIKIDIETEGETFDGKEMTPYIKGYDWKRSDDRKLGNYAESLRDFIVEEMKDRGLELE